MRPSAVAARPGALALGAVLVLAVGWIGLRSSAACSCSQAFGVVWILPGEHDPAPTNSHVWVFGAYQRDLRATLRVAEGDAEVPVTARRLSFGEVTALELVPTAPLAPNRTYEVVAASSSSEVETTFTTGDGPDETAPDALRFDSARYRHPPMDAACRSGNPFVELKLHLPDDVVMLAIWTARSDGIDYTRPPDAWHPYDSSVVTLDFDEFFLDLGRGDDRSSEPTPSPGERPKKFELGDPHQCGFATYDLPPPGTTRIGVRGLDLAGNRTAAVEFDVVVPVPDK